VSFRTEQKARDRRTRRQREAALAAACLDPVAAVMARVEREAGERAGEHERTVVARKRRGWVLNHWLKLGAIDEELHEAAEDYVECYHTIHGAGATALDPGRVVVDAGPRTAPQLRALPEAERLRRYTAALLPNLRAVVDLILVHNRSATEVAKQLGIAKDKVMRAAREGLEHIAEAWREWCGEAAVPDRCHRTLH
jgi:DNA-directed RNA polymerase specialized sigma24 family protein